MSKKRYQRRMGEEFCLSQMKVRQNAPIKKIVIPQQPLTNVQVEGQQTSSQTQQAIRGVKQPI